MKSNFWPLRLKRSEAAGPDRAAGGLGAELDTLRGSICEMGGLAEAAIREAMEALVRRDQGEQRSLQTGPPWQPLSGFGAGTRSGRGAFCDGWMTLS